MVRDARPAGDVAGSSAPQVAPAARQPRRVSLAGRSFAQITVLPVLLVLAWLLPGVALLLAGQLRPAPLLLIAVPLAVILIAAVTHRVPGWRLVPVLAGVRGKPVRAWAGWCGLGGTLAVATGYGAWQILLNSPQIIVLRQPGAVFQAGYWIAAHGSLPISQSLAAFGGAHPGLSFSSLGFGAAGAGMGVPGAGVPGAGVPGAAGAGAGASGAGIAPEFMPGLPILLAGGWWIHGMTAAALIPPVLGALALVTFGGLAGRLIGPQWGPAAAAILGLSLPEQYTSRAAFLQPLAEILVLGGLCLVVDSLTSPRGRPILAGYADWLHWPDWLPPRTAAAALGGLALGMTAVVSLDALPFLIPVIPFLGVAVAVRRPVVIPFGAGLLAGLGLGVAAGQLAAPGYRAAPGFAVRPVSLITLAAAVVTLVAVLLASWPRVRGRARVAMRAAARWWLPEACAVLVAAVVVAFLIRPAVQTVHWRPGAATVGYVAALQRLLGLPVEPTRSYAEDSMYWVIWYIGIPALLLGGFGAALLTRRCVRALLRWQDDEDRTARAWALPLAVFGWGTVFVLWTPNTVPDQPWASRVLVPLVLPGFVLCAVWVAAWLGRRARERGAGLAAVALAAACFVVALAVPTAVTTLGLSFGNSASAQSASAKAGSAQPGSAQPGSAQHSTLITLTGLGVHQTGAGQSLTVQRLCGTMSSQMSVLLVDRPAADEFAQVIRGMCKVPTGVVAGATVAEVRAVERAITAKGREPVLLATRSAELARFQATPRQVIGLNTTQEPHNLTQPPGSPWQITYSLWMLVPGSSAPGA